MAMRASHSDEYQQIYFQELITCIEIRHTIAMGFGFTCKTEHDMSKGQDAKKMVKKKSDKTLKEKREAKKEKKSSRKDS